MVTHLILVPSYEPPPPVAPKPSHRPNALAVEVMAIKMLAMDHLSRGVVSDDGPLARLAAICFLDTFLLQLYT